MLGLFFVVDLLEVGREKFCVSFYALILSNPLQMLRQNILLEMTMKLVTSPKAKKI